MTVDLESFLLSPSMDNKEIIDTKDAVEMSTKE